MQTAIVSDSPQNNVPVKTHADKPDAPPPEDDDFAARYAQFDEASVVAFSSGTPEEIPAEAPRSRDEDAEKIRAAEAAVSPALRKYLAEQFQTRFTRLVSGEKARIFSVRGALSADTSDGLVEETRDETDPDE